MSIFKGEKISVEIYGTSHADQIGVICTGFPIGKIDNEKLVEFMQRRKPSSQAFSTKRKEPDEIIFESGVDKGVIVDGNFKAFINNVDRRSQDYNELYGKPRPSHADYVSYAKFGTLDFRGGGKFSARLTAPLCIAGGIAKQILEDKGIKIYSYLSRVGSVVGKSYKDGVSQEELETVKGFPALSNGQAMVEEIESARLDQDSVGGVAECVIYGMPVGVGDSYFQGLEGKIALGVYSVPAVKGVEFGSGFDLSKMRGYDANDQFYYDNGIVKTKTNNAGGINGGISNGMPITLSVAFRPTPSISKEQNTVDLVNKCDAKIIIHGRHDSCVAVRALPVLEGVIALSLLDIFMTEGDF